MWLKTAVCLILAAGLMVAGAPAFAAPETAEATPAAGTDAYQLQVGDVVGVVVLGEAAYSGSFSLRADGTLLFSDEMVGAVPIAGLTVAKATEVIASRIGDYVKNPSVLVTISRFKVMVVGEVRQPGQYDLDSGTRLAEAITRAGGPRDERRDLAQVYLTKANGQEVSFDLRAFREAGDESQNPVLSPGDRISVGRERSAARAEYRISGAVRKPGFFPLDHAREPRVSDALEECGRWTEEANPRSAQLIHQGGAKEQVDLMTLDGDPTGEGNKVLQDGDELFVPRNPVQISVIGGVNKPGPYRVAPGTSLLEAIALAGGVADGANLKSCAVVRGGPQPERIPVDLDKLMKKGDLSQNPTLVDRDVVMVPTPNRGGGSKKGVLDTVVDNVSRYWWLFGIL
jgi:polysaccharide export outer membrane protein